MYIWLSAAVSAIQLISIVVPTEYLTLPTTMSTTAGKKLFLQRDNLDSFFKYLNQQQIKYRSIIMIILKR